MKIDFAPKTNLGKWSLILIIVMPILFFIGSSFTDSIYESVPSGETILKDIIARPALALTMLAGMVCGILAFITGLLGVIKKNERSILVYLSTIIGFLLILFLIAHIFPD